MRGTGYLETKSTLPMEALAFDFSLRTPRPITAELAALAEQLRAAWIAPYHAALDRLAPEQQTEFPALVQRLDWASQVQIAVSQPSPGRYRIELAPMQALAALSPEGTAAVRLFLIREVPAILALPSDQFNWLAGPGDAWPVALQQSSQGTPRRGIPTYVYVGLALCLLPWLVGGWIGYRVYTWADGIQGTFKDLNTRIELASQTITAQAAQLDRLKAEGEHKWAQWQEAIGKAKDYLGD